MGVNLILVTFTWKIKDGKTCVDIILHFGDPQIQLVESLKTSKRVLGEISIYIKINKSCNPSHKHKRNWIKFQCLNTLQLLNSLKNFEDISQKIENFQGIPDEASIIGLVILEEQKCVLLLGVFAS